jgi:hypothetical protein
MSLHTRMQRLDLDTIATTVYVRPAVAMEDRRAPNLFAVAAGAALLFLVAGGAFIGALWAISKFVAQRDVQTVAAFIFGLAFLLAIIAGIVAAFSALRLTNPKTALGLPEGSIRAIIALVLVLIFIVMAIYLIETVFIAPPTEDAENPAAEDARNAATQLLATVGTLVAAVAAFYFGTGAVTTGTVAATAAAAAARERSPGATTKGSKPVDKAYELHGFVNPHGRASTFYFEYGETTEYGMATTPDSAGTGNTEQLVNSGPILELKPGWHFRLVAHSDAGTTYGDDAAIDMPTHEELATQPEPRAPRSEDAEG